MTIPAFTAKGTASQSNADPCTLVANVTPNFPATVSANDVAILVIRAGTISSVDVITVDSSFGTWTALFQNGLGTTTYMGVFYLVCAGTEGGASLAVDVTFGGSSTSNAMCQIYGYSGSGTGLIDTSSGGTTAATSTTPSFSSVTTSLANQLAVGILTVGASTTANSVTGETGGDWTESAAEDNGITNKTMQVQSAQMVSAGTISGGTCTIGSFSPWRTFSFALKEATAASVGRRSFQTNFAVKRASSF